MNAKVMQYERHGNAVLNAVPDLDSKIKHIKAASKKMDIGKNMFTFQFYCVLNAGKPYKTHCILHSE